jgi:hypothetical protein
MGFQGSYSKLCGLRVFRGKNRLQFGGVAVYCTQPVPGCTPDREDLTKNKKGEALASPLK